MTTIPADRRLVRLFESATDAELDYGLTWYADANAELRARASWSSYTVDQLAGATAALSPLTSWPENLRKLDRLIETGETHGFGDGIRKAKRILAGEAPLDVLGGPKVRSFYSNLTDPEHSDAVTIDQHAYNAWRGMAGPSPRGLESKGRYEAVSDAYRSAARVLGVKPHVAQAVVWSVWRNRFGRYHYQRIGNTEAPAVVERLDKED